MRYTIGVQIVDKTGELCNGLYVIGKYGLPFILTDNAVVKDDDRIEIFNDLEEAKIRKDDLQKSYRFEFHSTAKRVGADISLYRFYILKVDSLNFKRKLGKKDIITKKSKYNSIERYYIKQ